MELPDYGPSVEQVGTWIATGAKLTPSRTLVLEPDLPEAPDGVAAVFEHGGKWDMDRGLQHWNLVVVTRGATLSEARTLAIKCLREAVKGFESAPDSEAGIITNVDVANLPILRGRDHRNRLVLESSLEMTIHAPASPGHDL